MLNFNNMKIPIVNEDDEIIGEEERSIIHQKGLKHREIHIWLVTPEKEFIFQERGKNQDTWPEFLDVTVGGHVDLSTETYEECAQRELFEETGSTIPIEFITKTYSESFDPSTNTYNNAFRTTFAAIFNQDLKDLKLEEGKGVGFRKYSLQQLSNMSESEKSKFIPAYFNKKYQIIYKQILDKLFI